MENLGLSWEPFFEQFFERVKKQLRLRYKVEEDGSGPPENVAIKKFVNELPCAIKILMLKVDQAKFPHLKDETCPLIGYDFTRMGKVIVDYLDIAVTRIFQPSTYF